MADSDRTLYAFEIHAQTDMPIEPAPASRTWMDETHERFAYRCLPLVIANQAGWVIRNPIRFTARWNGGPRIQDVRIWFPKGCKDGRISSHFGNGILTFSLPYLFRTPPDVNLWAKGPSNWIKDGIQPLEGVIETDWAISTFTMNWKFTRPNHSVRFEQGDPICMIVPVTRTLAEQLQPRRASLSSHKEICRQYEEWSKSRGEFNAELKERDSEAAQLGWQKHYMQGRNVTADDDETSDQFDQHQTRLHLKEFKKS